MSETAPSFPAPTELTLGALIDGREIETVLLFSEPLTYEQAQYVRLGWEKGLAQGKEIGRNWEER
jgi:hypothetical protein